ncbi:hypothetical protein G436_3943 [Leptospira interrogans serovar Hardjo str. Norma]|uniref:Uncharacterized protein n=1 Tax=Leptospira interrogans serovar Hardjo str. Norma TaxID=1279460 RepID=A0A0M3TMM1_LEPIR|nr:hypothetical protein G436_3943 [Leptospira interrogans serovar Hardjo str. Norma]
MWELPQITILLTNSKIAETHIFRKSFLFPYTEFTLFYKSS